MYDSIRSDSRARLALLISFISGQSLKLSEHVGTIATFYLSEIYEYYECRFSKSQTFSPRVNQSMRWHMMAPNSPLGPCFHGQQVTNCQKLAWVQHEVGVFSVQLRLNKTGP